MVSAGDEGRIIVWQLTPEGKRSSESVKGKQIKKIEHIINSIDINSQGNMVIIGGEEYQQTQKGKKYKPLPITLN